MAKPRSMNCIVTTWQIVTLYVSTCSVSLYRLRYTGRHIRHVFVYERFTSKKVQAMYMTVKAEGPEHCSVKAVATWSFRISFTGLHIISC